MQTENSAVENPSAEADAMFDSLLALPQYVQLRHYASAGQGLAPTTLRDDGCAALYNVLTGAVIARVDIPGKQRVLGRDPATPALLLATPTMATHVQNWLELSATPLSMVEAERIRLVWQAQARIHGLQA